jgi:hypothetical protein
MKSSPNQITTHDAGRRTKFLLVGSVSWSGVCEFRRLPFAKPAGVPASNPGWRATSYPWSAAREASNPTGCIVCVRKEAMVQGLDL